MLTVRKQNCHPAVMARTRLTDSTLSKISKTEGLIVYSCMKQDGGLTLKGMTNRRHRIILGTGNNLSFHFW